MVHPTPHAAGSRPTPARLYLRCPRCGLRVGLRVHWLTVEHCPRCLARAARAVELVPAGDASAEPPRTVVTDPA